MDDTKVCTACGALYPATTEFFYKDRSKKCGLRPLCKDCARGAKRAYDALHRAPSPTRDFLKGGAVYRVCDDCGEPKPLTPKFYAPEGLPSGKTFLRNVCRECRSAKNRQRYSAYYAANREKIAAERAKRYEEDADYRERVRFSNSRWSASERGRELSRINKLKHYWQDPERHRRLGRVHTANRRARKLAVGGEHTAEDIERQYDSQAGRCWWCGAEVGESFHVDHRIPIARGGTGEAGNLVISCEFCNLSKGTKMPWEFAGRLL